MKTLLKNIKYFLLNFIIIHISTSCIYFIYASIDILFHKYDTGLLGAVFFVSIVYLGFSLIFSLLLSLSSIYVKSIIKIWQHKLLIFIISIIDILFTIGVIDIDWIPDDDWILSMYANSAIIYAIIIGIYIKIRQKYFKKSRKGSNSL